MYGPGLVPWVPTPLLGLVAIQVNHPLMLLLFLPQEQDKPKALPLEEAVTSIQELIQLSVAIAFNFLGTWFPSSRQGDGEREWGGWNTVRVESVYLLPGR